MKGRVKVFLCGEDGLRFFGEGPYRLLCGVRELGSLRASAARMGMAYTKALALLRHGEEELGFPLTRRKTGGAGGGGSCLTKEAEELMKRYEQWREAVAGCAESLYHTYFSGFGQEEPAPHREPGSGEDHPAGKPPAAE